MSTMVKQDNPAMRGGSDSELFSQNRQIRSAQVIGDLGYNDEIERSGGHLARKRCPNKADVSTSHAPSRLGYCGRRTVGRPPRFPCPPCFCWPPGPHAPSPA